MSEYKDGDRVIVSKLAFSSPREYPGVVIGANTDGLVNFYIVEVLDRIPDETYPFSVAYLHESLIKKA